MITQLYRSLSAVGNPHRCLDSPNAATGQGACLISLIISPQNIKVETTRQMPRQATPMWLLFAQRTGFMDLYVNSRQKGGPLKKRNPLKLPQLKDMRFLQRQSKSNQQLEPCLSF